MMAHPVHGSLASDWTIRKIFPRDPPIDQTPLMESVTIVFGGVAPLRETVYSTLMLPSVQHSRQFPHVGATHVPLHP